MTTIRVVAGVVDGTKLTLYKEDGTTAEIQQGDPQLAVIIKHITPILSAGQVAEVTINTYEPPKPVQAKQDHTFKEFEEKSGGLTRLFRVAKKFVQDIIHPNKPDEFHSTVTVAPQVIGTVPTEEITGNIEIVGDVSISKLVIDNATLDAPKLEAPEKLSSAIDEILANAQPVSDPAFDDRETTEDHTIIAVVDNKIIPGAENLKGQMATSNKTGNSKGMQELLRRVAAVIDKRGHSTQDLLRFLEKGDLPIADDGSIIAYKVLKSTSKAGLKLEAGTFVDCHTGKVTQRVGSFVCVDPKLVDPSRTNECSNGLHIARRGYLNGFSGDIIVLCKIAPEDVIAVPTGDPHKVRVCGYHILAQIPANDHTNLRANRQLAYAESQRLLTMAIKGEHIGRIEEVRINGQYGADVVVTQLTAEAVSPPKVTTKVERTKAIDDEHVVDKPAPVAPAKPKLEAPMVDPKAVAAKATKLKAGSTRNQGARKLFDEKRYSEVIDIKKKAKVSWDKLGFNQTEVDTILGSKPKAESTRKVTDLRPIDTERMAKTGEVAPIGEREPGFKEKKMTVAEEARQLFNNAINGDKTRWGTLWQHKKKAKKSWEVLGFNAKEIERINTNKPDWI